MKIKEMKVLKKGIIPKENIYPNSKVINAYNDLRILGYGPMRWAGFGSLSVIEIETDNEIRSSTITSDLAAEVLFSQRTHLIGEDVDAHERIFDRIYRLLVPYERKGTGIMALSTLDNLIWDLKAKDVKKPLYKLLGGGTRETIPVYASLPANNNLESLKDQCVQTLSDGYIAIKIRFPYGPADGIYGIQLNLDIVRQLRDRLGNNVDIMIDALMSWNTWFAEKMIRGLERFEIAWIEEPFIPDDFASLRRITKKTNIPISAGEHAYGINEFKSLIDAGVTILQPDSITSGGVTTLKKVQALSEAEGITVIPHTINLSNLHFIFSCPPNICPMAENYLWLEQFSKNKPTITNGIISIKSLNYIGTGNEF